MTILEDEQRNESIENYWELFNTFKDTLPKNFVDVFVRHGFHDFQLTGLKLSFGGSSLKLTLQLIDYWDDKKVKLVYKEISNFEIIGSYEKERVFGIWNCSELYPQKERYFHEIQFDENLTIKIEFKEVCYIKNN